jgi:hypothetical protein
VYSGVIYAVRPKLHPVAILAIAGCGAHWAHRRTDGSYIMTGATVRLFRDVSTGAFLDSFDNPFTGKRNKAAPNVLSGGGAVFPADGSSARAFGPIKDAVIAPHGFGASDPDTPLGGMRWSGSRMNRNRNAPVFGVPPAGPRPAGENCSPADHRQHRHVRGRRKMTISIPATDCILLRASGS